MVVCDGVMTGNATPGKVGGMQVHRPLGSSCSCLACRTQRRHVSQLFGSKLDQGEAKENALLSPRHSARAALLT